MDKKFTFKQELSVFYFRLMSRAATRSNVEGYTEKHHIIPRSCGGKNNRSNIVVLSSREHIVAHELLARMATGTSRRSMVFALSCMFMKSYKTLGRMFDSRTEAKARRLVSEERKGKSFSDEHRKKLSEARKGRPLSKEHLNALVSAATKARTGAKWSEETRAKTMEGRKNYKLSDEARLKMSQANKGKKRTFTKEHCEQLSLARKRTVAQKKLAALNQSLF
jgi:5-methylcytosine-specific restriction endonuclease McrA